MADVLVDKQSLQDIANSIRAKNGTLTKYKPGEMSSAIDDISTGGTKLYDNIMQMYNDENIEEGDLATVYEKKYVELPNDMYNNPDTVFYFPDVVILNSEAPTDYYNYFNGVDKNGSYYLYSSLTIFDNTEYGGTKGATITIGYNIVVQYSTDDFITFKKINTTTTWRPPSDFSYWSNMQDDQDGILYSFIKKEDSTINGIYEVRRRVGAVWVTFMGNITYSGSDTEPQFEPTNSQGYTMEVYNHINAFKLQYDIYDPLENDEYLIYEADGYIYLIRGANNYDNRPSPGTLALYNIAPSEWYPQGVSKKTILVSQYTSLTDFKIYRRGLEGGLYTEISVNYDYNAPSFYIEGTNYIPTDFSMTDITKYTCVEDNQSVFRMKPIPYLYDDGISQSSLQYEETDLFQTYNYIPAWERAYTQLTTIPEDVYQGSFMGPNGVQGGVMHEVTDLSKGDLYERARVFSGIYKLTPSSILTSYRELFAYKSDLIAIPYININDGITDLYHMFYNCSKLQFAPYLSNTYNVTNMDGMFFYCYQLREVPIYNTHSVTSMNYMFKSCSYLSDNSLNNILYMCAKAESYVDSSSTRKTLKQLDISSTQATKCQSLSNYQMFLDAGWTTGY